MSGHVFDAGHLYALFVEVKATANGDAVADVWTNPVNGAYSMQLPACYTYTVTATPYPDGFVAGAASVTLSGETVENFGLSPDASCTAPGYSPSAPFSEDFDGGNSWITAASPAGRGAGAVFFEPAGSHVLTANRNNYQDAVRNVTIDSRVHRAKVLGFGMNAGRLATYPREFTIDAPVDATTEVALHIGNTGSAPADWQLTSLDAPSALPSRAGSVPGRDVRCHGRLSPLSLLHHAAPACGRGGSAPPSDDSGWTQIATYPLAIFDNCAASDDAGSATRPIERPDDSGSGAWPKRLCCRARGGGGR